MPNLAFVFVNFAIHVSLAIWIGGTIFLGALAAPRIFESAPTRTLAGEIVGGIVGAFGKVKLACMAALVAGTLIRYFRWEAWNGWIALRLVFIAVACGLEVFATYGIGPRIMQVKAAMSEAGLDFEGDAGDPMRRRFRRLHGLAMGLQSLAVLFAAGALLTFS